MLRKTVLSAFVLFAGLFTAAGASWSADEYNVSNGLTVEGVPLAAHGVDVVSLATDTTIAAGTAQYTATHDGVAYYFSSQQSMEAFVASPAAYLPEFGGFCAFAVSLGKKFDGDPRYADIRDGKLYLFVNAAVLAEYQKDPSGTIAKADAKWKSIHHYAGRRPLRTKHCSCGVGRGGGASQASYS